MQVYHLLLCLAAAAVAVDAAAVHELTTDSFDAFLSKHELSLVSFIAPWCSFCQELTPRFEAAADALRDDNLPLGRVDCTEEKDLCSRYQIPIYPTLLAFQGKDHFVYNGPRKVSSMVGFMKRYSQPLVAALDTANDVAQFRSKDNITIVGLFDKEDEESMQTFTTIAEMYRDVHLFGAVIDSQLGQAEVIKKPALVLHKNFDEGQSVFSDEFSIERIEDFLEDMAVPLVREIGVDVELSRAGYKRRPVGFVFTKGQEEQTRLAAELKPIAAATRGQMVWVTADGPEYEKHAVKLALTPGKWPAFAIEDASNDFKYAYPIQGSEADINEQAIRQVVYSLLAGDLQPSILSEPIISVQNGSVTTIVGNTYKELVMNNDKDVLVFFHSPTCKHCKAMAPSYEEVGALLEPYENHVTVAKIDATRNDVWPKVSSYPVLKLFRSGAKDEPVLYQGDRTSGSIIEFVKKSASQQNAKFIKHVVVAQAKQAVHDEL